MDGSFDGSGSQSDDSYIERLHLERIYDSFVCPLTKRVMRDPVSLENGHTFEREAIENWFTECKESGRTLVCPITHKELNTSDLNPSIALRNTIEEWTDRNESAQLDRAQRSLSLSASENDILQALKSVQSTYRKRRPSRHVVRSMMPMIIEMLKSSSGKVRCKALETLSIATKEDGDNMEIVALGDTVRTIVKFLSRELSEEREQAVYLLYELSKSEALCEKIGSINGAILRLVGMTSSNSENILTVEIAEKTLENLEKCVNNVKQMAENGRLSPLLKLLLEGAPELKLSMATYLGDLAVNNDVKISMANSAGPSLISIMTSRDAQSREAAFKALSQISSCESSAKILIESGMLPPLVNDLFSVGSCSSKEVSAAILVNVVTSGYDLNLALVGPIKNNHHATLVSEDVVQDLLRLVSNTGPAVEAKLLQVLVGLTAEAKTVRNVVSAIRSSGAVISLVQFIEATQRDLRLQSIKLLQNVAPYMGRDVAHVLLAGDGQLRSLMKMATEKNAMISEEQAAAAGLLSELPECTRRMLEERMLLGTMVRRVASIRAGETRLVRFTTPYQEALVRLLARVASVISEEADAVGFCREHDLAAVFVELLQSNGLDTVQMVSAAALGNLSGKTKELTRVATPASSSFSWCCGRRRAAEGLCGVHRGVCSGRECFCILEGKGVEKLVGLLDHKNARVVEAALGALSSILEDGVDVEAGVRAVEEAGGINPILQVLQEKRTEDLNRRAVWVVERILRTDCIAVEISGDPSVSGALVDAFQHGDVTTKQIAERALRHIDRLPNFSAIFPNAIA